MTKAHRLGVSLAGLWLLQMEPAWAAFHLVMVTEVFPGYVSSPHAQYVELQMWAAGQNFVQGHSVQVFDAAGGLLGTFTFASHAANGSDQASLLIATAEAQSLFGVAADLTMTPVIALSGGKVCFTGSSDCVAWGAYTGSTAGVGNPFAPGGLTLGGSAQRRLDRGSPAALDPSDDTDDSATDFVAAPPTPRTNSNATGAAAGYGSTPAPPGPIAFGSGVVGVSLEASLTVHETGGGTLTVSDPLIGGAQPGDFSVVTSFPVSVPGGAPPQAVGLSCTPQAQGPRTATLSLTTNDPALPAVVYELTCTGQPPPSLSFHTVVPCRAVDTRTGGGPVEAGVDRTIAIAGVCGVPATAHAVSLNVTVTQPTQTGNVRLFPAGGALPVSSTLNFVAGLTRANNAVIGLGDAGGLTVRAAPAGSTHLILDVNGYFE